MKRPAATKPPSLALDLKLRLMKSFTSRRKPGDAAQMTRYMKGMFPFFGLKAPERRQAAGEVIQRWKREHAIESSEDLAFQVLRTLYGCEEREMHYVGAEFCADLMKRGPVTPQFLSAVRFGVTTKSWWDTVDIFAASAMSPYILTCGQGKPCAEVLKTMDSWAVAENLWQRRTAILSQMKLRTSTDLKRLRLGALLAFSHPFPQPFYII